MTAYLSICSGIEAASVAWHPLGWVPLAFSEIDGFARAVLRRRFPDVPLHGDFTRLRDESWIADADVLVGGTPCQSFSVAGLRQSLADDRGNLTLEFVRLADAIDDLRRAGGRRPSIIVWENVPGVLSTKDNAFGCFLGALVGADAPLVPARGQRWTNAGLVVGPRRAAAWRILDAQFFGVPQRRRRVFVISSAREGFDPAAVLLEQGGLQGNPPPSREAWQADPGPVGGGPDGGRLAGTVSSKWSKGAGGPAGDEAYNLVAGTLGSGSGGRTPGLDAEGAVGNHQIAGTLSAGMGSRSGKGGNNAEEHFLVAGTLAGGGRTKGGQSLEDVPVVTHALRADGFDASEDGTGRGTGRGTPLVAVPFDTTQITNKDNRSQPKAGDPSHPLTGTGHPPAIAFKWTAAGDHTTSLPLEVDKSPTLNAAASMAIAFDARQSDVHVHGDKTGAVDTKYPGPAIAFAGRTRGDDGRGYSREAAFNEERTGALDTVKPPRVAVPAQAVRRLTPRECERLQGFPDDWTRIENRKYRKRTITKTRPRDRWEKVAGGWALMAADGPRYKAIGNSMAVPVMAWIGHRIQFVESLLREAA